MDMVMQHLPLCSGAIPCEPGITKPLGGSVSEDDCLDIKGQRPIRKKLIEGNCGAVRRFRRYFRE